jgi:hypothetical protein
VSGQEEPAAGEAGLGLSKAHISRKQREGVTHVAGVWENGRLLRVGSVEPQVVENRGIRGEVVGFSAASRRRLLYLVASINRSDVGVPLFVTLTYPGEEWERFGGRKEDVKRHLDTLHHWLSYHYPSAVVIWRQEFQKRGAPHFHLLVFGVEFIDCYLVAFEWYRVVGSGQESHLAAGTQVKGCKSWEQATAYVAKYMAKLETFAGSDVPIHSRPGRIWGVWNREALPRELVGYGLTDHQFFRLRRLIRGYCKSRGYALKPRESFAAFLGSAAGHRALAWVGAKKADRIASGASSAEVEPGL